MRRVIAVVAVAALAACARSPAEAALADAAGELDGVHSGFLTFEYTARAKEGPAAGFGVRGPFSLRRAGELPVARLEYTQIAGDSRSTQLFLSTGERAFAGTDGSFRELPDEATNRFRQADREGLGRLELAAWAVDARVSDGPAVDGEPTRRISGELDAGRALRDINAMAVDLGAEAIADIDPADVERAAGRSTMVALVGSADGILRDLDLHIELVADVPQRVIDALGRYGGATIDVSLALREPNRDVEVPAPVP